MPATNITLTPTHGTDLFTLADHGMVTGDGPYRLTTTLADLPLNLLVDTDYWIIAPTADTFKLASSYANAIASSRPSPSSAPRRACSPRVSPTWASRRSWAPTP